MPASALARPRSLEAAKPLPPRRPAPPAPAPGPLDVWDDAAAPEAAAACARAQARAKPPAPPQAGPKLQVCAPGASYNPAEPARQELVAAAVAVEFGKELRKELRPPKPPLLGAPVAALTQGELLFAAEEQPEAEEEAGAEGEGEGGRGAAKRPRPLTRADRSRKRRGRDAAAAADAARAAKRARRELASLPALAAELDAEAGAAAGRRARRDHARAERAARPLPGRLGRQPYVAPPICVALEGQTGSLLRVPSVPTLIADRYLSLQRAGVVEPRNRARYVRSRSYSEYAPGNRGAKELELQAAVAEQRRVAAGSKKARHQQHHQPEVAALGA